MAEARDLSVFVTRLDGGVSRMDLAVEGITCAACMIEIEGGLSALPSVTRARVNLTNRRVAVEWKDGEVDPARLIDRLSELGYRAHPFDPAQAEAEEAREARWLLTCTAVAGFAAMNIMLLSVSVWSGNVTDITPETRDFFHWLSALIAIPAVAYAGQPFFRSAMRALLHGSLNMDVPITLGVLLAVGMSVVETLHHAEHAYFDSAVMLLFFLLTGRFLDINMRRRTRAVAGNLAALKAETAAKFVSASEIAEVPVAAIKPGDLVLVRPGDRIAVDGVVEDGRSKVDAALVTGETGHAAVGPGARVYAGTVNVSGTLRVRVAAAASGTLLDEVMRLLDHAVQARSQYVRLADRAARFYAPVVHLTALATLLGWLALGAPWQWSLTVAITVLIITCPCALALAIPAVQVVAAGALFRHQVLLNAGDAIERFAEVDTVVFDKTGTLTTPEPAVANLADIPGDVLQLAGRLALGSRHPMAAALARATAARQPVEGAREEPGQGVGATLDGVEVRLGRPAFCGAEADAAVVAACDPDASLIAFSRGTERWVFALRQTLRRDAAAVVGEISARGYRVEILSGDRAAAVARAAAELGVKDWRAGLTPAAKIARISELKAAGRNVLMVGDGLNDAPALAAADVSLSPVTAVHLAQAAADAVFLGERLAPVAATLAICGNARQLMRQNLALAIVYNAVAVPVAIAGLVTPLIAALAMSGSSLLVTVNALRARGATEGSPPATAPACRTAEEGG
ncbi:heavy metal translocating P-type ATPase [Blastochloris viridis]|uniref:Putative copper-importing P-type ATPase A n=1 Tax=Blastochloris viridis TaxID=1079 RepID=A0A0H5BEB2_BLAVI|nr:heavy metal translocating P-type ATPase [Blastochloris viridis]ALK10638.1 putative copper-importing P-type ATPase A [Blastochloris viridis]BAR99404.1 type cbb3 cytochrome oxidase biogenesis protein CcoI [Blastochloris viridis]CUU43301.1 putative copper-importing P-type ATPase A [Blastochloris viridis]